MAQRALLRRLVKKVLGSVRQQQDCSLSWIHNKEGENENQRAICPTKELRTRCILLTYTMWSHLGLNQGLPDYESGALTD